jgi:hypothetical protein
MGKHLGIMFLPSIYTERVEGKHQSDGRQINLGSWVVSTTYVLKNTQSRHSFIIEESNDKTII